MPKKPRIRTLMESQHVKGYETLHKFKRQYFVISFDNSERKSARKTLFEEYLKSWDCLLTYWYPMTSILSQLTRVFHETNSNAIIWKSKKTFWTFFSVSEISIKFGILWKKRWTSELFVSEIIDCKKWGCLNAEKEPCQNT